MSESTLSYFLFKVGKNLYSIVSEIDKLRYWLMKNLEKTIDEKIIDLVVYGQVEVNSFLFLDYLLPEKEKAVGVLDKIHESGGDEYQTLGMVYWGLKLYVYLLDLYKQGIRDNKTLAQMTKYAPFAVSKAMKNIKLLEQKE